MISPENSFREFRVQLSRFIAKRISNPDEVDDILQDVFVRVVRNEKSLLSAQTPLAWLYTVTRSVLVDHYRKQNRTLPQAMNDMALDELPAPPQYTEPEFEECLTPLVSGLPNKYRNAVKFVDMDGGKQTELAKQTGLSPSAAKSRVQRGRKMLKNSVLNCCRVELDNLNNVVALEPDNASQEDCC